MRASRSALLWSSEGSFRTLRFCSLNRFIAAEGGKADIAKPLKGLGSELMEVAVRYRTDAWRVVCINEVAGRLWVIHAFQKESTTGIKTPKAEIDLVRARIGRLKRELLQ